jgi:hypothetical protein
MSRWSRKTDEEKEEILRKQREQRDKSKKYQSKGDTVVSIYADHEIPIMCPKCLRYSGSDNYEIVIKDFKPLGIKKVTTISGICRKCKRPIERIIPPAFSEETIVFVAICVELERKGRLKDLRKK